MPLSGCRIRNFIVRNIATDVRVMKAPTSKCSRGFFNVLFRIVSDSQCEQFHHFASKVLVWVLGGALVGIEVKNHRRRLANFLQQSSKVSACMFSKHLLVGKHVRSVGNFFGTYGKMIVPKQSESFL